MSFDLFVWSGKEKTLTLSDIRKELRKRHLLIDSNGNWFRDRRDGDNAIGCEIEINDKESLLRLDPEWDIPKGAKFCYFLSSPAGRDERTVDVQRYLAFLIAKLTSGIIVDPQDRKGTYTPEEFEKQFGSWESLMESSSQTGPS